MEQLINDLLKALHENQNFEYNENGLKISSKSENNTTSIKIEYNGIVEDELGKFIDYVSDLEDDVFIGTCEFLGSESLNKIQELLDSGVLTSVEKGISEFKKAISEYAKEQVKYWEKYV